MPRKRLNRFWVPCTNDESAFYASLQQAPPPSGASFIPSPLNKYSEDPMDGAGDETERRAQRCAIHRPRR